MGWIRGIEAVINSGWVQFHNDAIADTFDNMTLYVKWDNTEIVNWNKANINSLRAHILPDRFCLLLSDQIAVLVNDDGKVDAQNVQVPVSFPTNIDVVNQTVDWSFAGAVAIDGKTLMENGGSFVKALSRGIYEIPFNVFTTALIFKDGEKAKQYLLTGIYDEEDVVNPPSSPVNKRFYIGSRTYRTNGNKDDKELVAYHHLTIDGNFDAKVGGYVTQDAPYNIHLKQQGLTGIYYEQKTDAELPIIGHSWSSITNDNWTYSDIVQGADGLYFGVYATQNIPIFASESELDDYLNGLRDASGSLNGGGTYRAPEFPIGENVLSTPLNSGSTNDLVLSQVYESDAAGMRALAAKIYDDDTTTLEQILEGLKMYGENPISFMISSYYYPINIDSFITKTSTSTVPFGSYQATLSAPVNKVHSNYTYIDMFNVYFSGAFGDFRDYQSKFYIYLPFVGITSLDTDRYLYQDVSCKCFLDIRTGNIKYFLMIKGGQCLVDTYEGSIGIAMPITGSDNALKARQAVSGALAVYQGVSVGIQSGRGASPTGIISGIGTSINGALDFYQSAPKHVSGNLSSSTAIKDPLAPYLIIEQPEIILPANLRTLYNIPDDSVNMIGTYRGFLMMDNVHLTVTALEEELDEINTLLTSGIIV